MEIYEPAEDSYFLEKFLEKFLKNNRIENFLDMGTGSGILSKKASEFIASKNILATDINKEAINSLRKQKFRTVHSNLFHNIKEKFDLIVFNAPYLPLDEREPKSSRTATTGGQRGDEIPVQFLNQAKSHLNHSGKIFLLISSLTPVEKIKKVWNYKIIAKKKLFMEELLILEFKQNPNNP